jgi:hypothetical protein
MGIRRLCDAVRQALRREDYQAAFQIADDAVAISRRAFSKNLYGAALLHRCVAHLYTELPRETEQSIRDCDQATGNFFQNPHNLAVGQILRALLDIYLQQWRDALVHLSEAVGTVDGLIVTWQKRGNSEKAGIYADLRADIDWSTKQLAGLLADVDRIESGPPTVLADPKTLVWPDPDSSDTLSVPLHSPFVITSPSKDNKQDPGESDKWVRVSKLLIQHEPFKLRPRDNDNDKPVQLEYEQNYIATNVEGEHGALVESDEYILVRLLNPPSASGRNVVVDSTPIENLGSRRWVVKDGSETEPYSGQDMKMIGLIEAVLTPAFTLSERLRDFKH